MCHSGECIETQLICNENKNCFDESDEICGTPKAISDEYKYCNKKEKPNNYCNKINIFVLKPLIVINLCGVKNNAYRK